jgi:hypothetical protein
MLAASKNINFTANNVKMEGSLQLPGPSILFGVLSTPRIIDANLLAIGISSLIIFVAGKYFNT